MGSWQVAVLLVRRWYVTLGAFLATVGVAAVAYASLPAQYQTGSVMVVTTSLTGRTAEPASGEPDLTNPLLNFENDVNLAAAILIEQLNSPELAEALGAPAGGTTTYVVSDGNTNDELLQSGPLLFVQGNGPTPEAAESITQRVDAMAAVLLDRRQRELDAPPSTYVQHQRDRAADGRPPADPQPESRRRGDGCAGRRRGAGRCARLRPDGGASTEHRRRPRRSGRRPGGPRSAPGRGGAMTALQDSPARESERPRPPRTADATTMIAVFVVLQFGLPATLVLNYLPMSLPRPRPCWRSAWGCCGSARR